MQTPGDGPRGSQRGATDGHLARLVQRARPTEALLQRRQPSMFEPPRPGVEAHGTDDADAPVDAVMTAPTAAPRSDAPAATRGSSSHQQESGGVEIARKPPPTSAPAAQPLLRPELRVVRETLRIDPSVRTRHAVSAPAERPARPVAPGETPSPPATRRMAARAVDGPSAPRPSADHPQAAPVAAHAPPRGEPLGLSPARATWAADTAAPLLRPRHAPSVLPASLPRSTQRATAAQSALLRQPAPPALPPVQVTIGRVEVRAVAAPAVAERSARAVPRLGLEQYLRERHGGHR